MGYSNRNTDFNKDNYGVEGGKQHNLLSLLFIVAKLVFPLVLKWNQANNGNKIYDNNKTDDKEKTDDKVMVSNNFNYGDYNPVTKYVTGPAGPAGATGATGAPGKDGLSLSAFAYVYSINDQEVEKNAAILFESPSTVVPIVYNTGSSAITLSLPGNYLVNFEVSPEVGSDGDWDIVNGSVKQLQTYSNRSSNGQIFGGSIIKVTDATNITIVNSSEGPVKLLSHLSEGGKYNKTVSALVSILKLS